MRLLCAVRLPLGAVLIALLGLASIRCGLGESFGEPEDLAITRFDVSPDEIAAGSSARLDWAVRGADLVEIDNGVGPVRHEGFLQVTPAATTVYTITAIAGTLRSSSMVRVVVEGAEAEPSPTPTPDPSSAPIPTPTPRPTPTPEPELCWELKPDKWPNCRPCTDAEQARHNWPLDDAAGVACGAFDHWMPCRCDDGGQWPGVKYRRENGRWYWEKDGGACDPAPGKCFCHPEGRENAYRYDSQTCQVIHPEVRQIGEEFCEWEKVPCSG